MSQLGTPKTLLSAIQNGVAECHESQKLVVSVERHVIDFLAQKFSILFVHPDSEVAKAAEQVWSQIKFEVKNKPSAEVKS